MDVLVLDGNTKSALSIVRSLGRRGIAVAAGATRQSAMTLHSRYIRDSFVYPAPRDGQRQFVDALKAFVQKIGDKPYVFACSDETYMTLFQFRKELEDVVTLVFPSSESVTIAFDKFGTYSLARTHSIPTIHTYIAERSEEIKLLKDKLLYPAVVKVRSTVSWKEDGKGVVGSATFVQNGEELEHRILDSKEVTGVYPLIQDFVRGEEYGVEMIAENGAALGIVVHHRIRSLSPSGGAAVVKEVEGHSALREQLIEYSKILVQELSWQGPIMIEWKVDSDSREPKLMEINGRFWGSLPLALASGVDLPYLYYEILKGRRPNSAHFAPKEGTQTRHFLGDVAHLLKVFFKRDSMRTYTYPRRGKALKDFMASTFIRGDVWSWRDPLPSLFEYIDILKR